MGNKTREEAAGDGEAAERDAPGCAGELVELAARGEDDERDLRVAEHGELERLLEQPVAALGEGDLPARRVLDPLHLRFPPHHPAETGVQPNPRTLPKYTARRHQTSNRNSELGILKKTSGSEATEKKTKLGRSERGGRSQRWQSEKAKRGEG
jgi:hypothetical protein